MENPLNSTPNTNTPSSGSPAGSVDGLSRPSSPSTESMGQAVKISSPSSGMDNGGSSPSNDPMPPDGSPPSGADKPPLAASITSTPMSHEKSKTMTMVLLGLVLLVLVGGIYGVYKYQQDKINKMAAALTAQGVTINSLNAQVKKLNVPSLTLNQGSSNSTLTVVKLTPIGVSLSLPPQLADLTFVANSGNTQVNLSTQTLTALDAACTANATTGQALGTMTNTPGQFSATKTPTVALVKQYSTYYIGYIKSPAPCSKDADVTNLVNSLTTDLKNSFSTITVLPTT